MTPQFCPRCHARIGIPEFVRSGKFRMGPEAILKVTCGARGCKGALILSAKVLGVEAEPIEETT